MKTSEKHIYFIANGICRMSMGGGDKNFIEVAKRLKKFGHKITVITNPIGKKIYVQEGLHDIEYILTDNNPAPVNNSFLIPFMYIVRGFKSLLLVKKITGNSEDERYFILTSDFYCDTLSLICLRSEKAIQIINMVASSPFLGYQNKFHFPRINEIHYFLSNYITFLILKLFVNKKNCKIIVITKSVKKKLLKNILVNDKDIVVINYGTDAGKSIIKNLSGIKRKEYDFVWIGRNHPQKGIEDLKKILVLLKEKMDDFKILLIGDLASELKDFKKKNNLERNLFLKGTIFGDKKFIELSKSKIFLFTSHFESFGIVVLENMLVGNLVVGYDIESSRENFSKNMIFVKKFDYKSFADTAFSVLKNIQSKKEEAKYNQKFAMRYNWNETTKKYLTVMNSFKY